MRIKGNNQRLKSSRRKEMGIPITNWEKTTKIGLRLEARLDE